jgi:FlgD Ig-like domain
VPSRDYNRGAVARTATTVLVLGVLAASATAFAISEGLKVQKATITAVRVAKTFSPVCRCPTGRATIQFRLTRAQKLRISIVDAQGDVVRTLVRGRTFGRGQHTFTWNGRDDVGAIVAQGDYRPRVRLEQSDRTLTLPNPMSLDVTRPRFLSFSVRPRVISPDGDGRADVVRVAYRISEHAHVLLLVNGRQRVRTLFQRLHDHVDWFGKVDGRALPAGRYRLDLVAVDLAGNRSRAAPAGFVRIRYVGLPAGPLRARAGGLLAVSVSTDAPRVRWRLSRGSSLVASGSGAHRLRLRVPKQAGRYTLVVATAGHQARAVLIVRAG